MDAQNFGKFVEKIDELINKSCSYGGTLKMLVEEEINPGVLGYLQYEVEKAKYIIVDSAIDQNRLDAIMELEKSPKLRGMIHNIFFDHTLNLERDKIDKLLAINPDLLLQCVQLFSKNLLLERKYNGDGKYLASGKEEANYYYDEEYFYKWFLGMNDSDFGDYLLASNYSHISSAVKKFISACSDLPFDDVSTEVEQLRSRQIKNLPVGSEPYYLAKYKEFYGESDICACLIPKNKRYAIRTLKNGHSKTGPLLSGGHYNPYYMALKNLVALKESKIQVTSSIIQTGKLIEEWYPLTLSNGVTMRLLCKGNWKIDLNGADISQASQEMLIDGILKNDGEDIIEKAACLIIQMA